MPATLKVMESGIVRCKDRSANVGEVVSNFTIRLLGTVDVDREAGGSGFLANIRRFPDEVERFEAY